MVTFVTNFVGQYTYGSSSFTEPFVGPSGLRFNAKAGATYFIAVDTKANTGFTISNGVVVLGSVGRGPVQLNWAFHPAGVFRFASEDVDETGILQTNGNPLLLYNCAETEGGGLSSLLGSINAQHGEVGPFTSANEENTLFHAYYYYDVEGLLVTVTRVAGSSGRVSVDYSTVDGNTNIINNGDIPAVAGTDYTPVQGTLIFNDFEMSKTIVVPIIDRNPFDTGISVGIGGTFPLQNRDFTVQLSNPQRDPSESDIVSIPRVDPVFGQVECRILSTSIDPKGPSTFSQVLTNIGLGGITNVFTNTVIADQAGHLLEPTNALFNFSKANYRFVRDESSYWNNTLMTVYVNRRGTNTGSVTVHYRIDNLFEDQNGPDDDNIEFPLQPGSDYAVPTPPNADGIKGAISDFAGSPGDTGSFSSPGGKVNTFQSQPIHFTIQNKHLTEFNKDFLISLYEDDANNNPQPDGMVAESTVTILFDDTAPPAGSVDELYNPDYASDLAFATNNANQYSTVSFPGTDVGGNVYAVVLTTNNQAIIGGAFATYTDFTNTFSVSGIARLNADGSVDTNFIVGTGVNVQNAGEFVSSIAMVTTNLFDPINIVTNVVQSGLVIGGNFSSYNGNRRNGIARLNLDGTLDTTFNPGAGANGTVWAVLAQPDGRVIIGGDFTMYNGSTANHIARLNQNGSFDTTFNASNLITGSVYAMAWPPTNSSQTGLLIGGNFNVTGQFFANLARLNSDGSLDATFNPGTGPNGSVLSLACQANSQIIVGGSFSSISGVPLNNLARLNSNGSIDASFYNGIGADNSVNSVMLDPSSGLIYIGGPFDMVNGTHRLGFARLNTDGTVDTSFLDTAYNQFAGLPRLLYDGGSGNGAVYASALQADGNVIVGGSFREVGGGQADLKVRQDLEKQEGLSPSTTNLDLLVSVNGTRLEPKTRDGVRNRTNLARLIGGSTTGPGNIGMVNNNYAANKTQVNESVTLVRANGSIGYAQANFAVLPGLAQSGADYQYDALPPIYPISWEFEGQTRQHSDGEFGPDGLDAGFLWRID